ncbi:hypothetical protein HMPREF3213_03259 [Heyndrickxia coagulans]|uniref:Uncharacterized protein n=1 Tax=Heyndrickxia coagulans TaxID=1398 RepID=A0A133KD53_HEYCO|nr:hypothetical protein HMPREF3213_03259 [Heyndrickxia coagulans]
MFNYLNTSNVKVQPGFNQLFHSRLCYLNTSNVKVQLLGFNLVKTWVCI